MSYRRYALYLTPPPESDLWRFGCDVIGRDALTGDLRAGFAPEGHELEAWHDLTSDPRRYGFHATLKAPFRLRADLDAIDLMDNIAAFARTVSPFDAGELHVGAMATDDGRAFVVLKPRPHSKALRALEDCVRGSTRFAPLRRRKNASDATFRGCRRGNATISRRGATPMSSTSFGPTTP